MIKRKNSRKGKLSFLHVALHLDLIYNPTKYYVWNQTTIMSLDLVVYGKDVISRK